MANALNKVNSGGIEDGSIVNADIKSDAAIAGSKLADNAVGLAQMASGTDGQIITYDASGDPIAVGPGTDGQVLTSTGAGSPPAFENLPTSGAALTGSTNNTVCTVTGANAIQGEANLTYDGDILSVGTGSGGAVLKVQGAEGGNAEFWLQADEGDDNADNWLIYHDASNNKLKLASKPGGSYVDNFNFQQDGNLEIVDGDIVIGTAGHGIDFSANSHASGMASELLDHYEEGTWSPTFANLANAVLNTNTNGEYIRIGNLVYIRCWVGLSSITGGQSWTLTVGGFPFTSNSGSYGRYPFAINAYGLSFGSDRQAIYSAMGEGGTTADIMSTDGTNPNVLTSQVTANNCTGSTSFYIAGSYHVLGY